MKILIVDAQEPGEPGTFLVDTEETKAPKHMMRMINRSKDKCFEHIMNDGVESMSGLVDEEHDSAAERAEEVFEYLSAQCINENKFKPGGSIADAYISIAAC